MDAVKYLVGLVIFSSIGSFLIVDTTAFVRVIGINNRLIVSDFLRLLVLAGMTAIGFMLAKETFVKPNDGMKFLVIGAIASISIYALGTNRRKAKARRTRNK